MKRLVTKNEQPFIETDDGNYYYPIERKVVDPVNRNNEINSILTMFFTGSRHNRMQMKGLGASI